MLNTFVLVHTTAHLSTDIRQSEEPGGHKQTEKSLTKSLSKQGNLQTSFILTNLKSPK